MNRFVSHRSILFLALAWVVALTLFADSANLDDICAGTVVLHDDDEIGSAADQGLAITLANGPGPSVAPLPRTKDAAAKSDSSPATPARVIVDQDSPSLAAEYRIGAMFETLAGAEDIFTIRHTPPSREGLYLQFCSLLI